VRVVLDTTVMVAALRSAGGASRQLLIGALHRRFQLLASVPLMIEYEAVLTRREHLKAAGLRAGEVKELLDGVAAVSEPIVPNFRWRPMLRDPNDDMVFEAAVNGSADLLVTFNKRDFDAVALGKMRIASPGEALKLLEESHEKK
jgi:putative PIN family toxin of toxin-antitoxin system